jgi:hypothetical protein
VATGSAKRDADGDEDNTGGGRFDLDDYQVRNLGRAAGALDARSIKTLVKRYYVAGATADGARACRMIYTLTAESTVEQYGEAPGRSELRGNTCAEVVLKLLKHHRSEFAHKLAGLHVERIRVAGVRGAVILTFPGGGEGYLFLHREFGAWRLETLLDERLP